MHASVTDCTTCGIDAVVLRNGRTPPHDVDAPSTTANLIERVRDGRMQYLRGDVPLEDMVDLAEADMKYTIVSYLRCSVCEQTQLWGLCIRGAPIYKPVASDAPSRWPWSEVPPRELWTRPGVE